MILLHTTKQSYFIAFPSLNFLRKLFQSTLLIRMFSHLCHRLYMQINTNEYIDMTSVAELLDNKVCSALMSLHCLTCSDTSGRFCHKSKEFWVKLYLENIIKDTDMLDGLIMFQTSVEKNTLNILESLICRGYAKNELFIILYMRLIDFPSINK